MDGLSTGVIVVDRNLLIVSLNPAAENLLGISASRARRQPLMLLLGDDAEFGDVLQRVLATGTTYANEMRLAPSEASSEEKLVDCRVSLLESTSSDAVLLVEMSDVTR
ncbi:MAG: PAS domain-containing protein, partial [Woeseiaceae bacterium]|nr:PAS domain-containing protein [Woeseiaceae bacterium]